MLVPIFDSRDNLLPLTEAHLDIRPRPDLVQQFGYMYTWILLRRAKKDLTGEFELFLELHRRAADHHAKTGKKEKWDYGGPGGEEGERNMSARRKWLRVYAEKWMIAKTPG